MKIWIQLMMVIAVAAALCGCVTPGDDSGRRNPSEVDRRFVTTRVDRGDYNEVVRVMVEAMLNRVLKTDEGRKPLIVLGNVFNNTPYNVKEQLLLNKIEVEMLRAGTMRFSAATSEWRKGGESGSLYKQLLFQNESGYVDPATIQKVGGLIGADWILYAYVENIETRAGGATESYFSFIMKMHSVKTGEVVWAEEAEITKVL